MVCCIVEREMDMQGGEGYGYILAPYCNSLQVLALTSGSHTLKQVSSRCVGHYSLDHV